MLLPASDVAHSSKKELKTPHFGMTYLGTVCIERPWFPNDPGVYIIQIIEIFAPPPPLFSKMIFFPQVQWKFPLFPLFFHLLPLIFAFFLNKSSHFSFSEFPQAYKWRVRADCHIHIHTQPTKNSYFLSSIKNIYILLYTRSAVEQVPTKVREDAKTGLLSYLDGYPGTMFTVYQTKPGYRGNLSISYLLVVR